MRPLDVMTYGKTLQGYKGGGGNPRSPVEAPDSLVSIENARIVDLLSEGEIVGLVNGINSIFLDEAPGSSYPSLRWDARVGTQDQTYMQGFPSVESEINIGVELQAATPWIRAVTDTTVSAIRINFALGRFAKQNPSNGDTNGTRVQYAIDVAEGLGPFTQVLSSAFSGKTTGGYTRSVRVDLPGPTPAGGWRIRVRRITPNSTSSAISDAVNIRSITEIVDYKFRYPNSALVATQFDAEAFGGKIPKRSFHIKGRVVRVPVNYDPTTRTYSGPWDGTFKLAYTNCPPWVYYDLLLNPRFGLGDRITGNQIDKWGLYQIAQYCDQMVDDGKGGQEPRFTCNLYLQKQADALKVLQDLTAIFRGITYWGLGQAIVSADMPSDPVYLYTNANVLNGKFGRKGSKKSTIYSVVLSSWNDPTDFYRSKTEYVQDDALVARYGVRSITLTNLGCSSQGQAQRAARWALLTNQYETDTITFSVGIEGIRALPGQVIRVADQFRQGRRVGGRLRDSSTASLLVVDILPSIVVEVGDLVVLNMPNGQSEARTVASVDLINNTITPETPFSSAPVRGAVWAYEAKDLKSELYRIISITEGASPLEYTITALTYAEGKHDSVDFGTIISTRPITAIPTSVVPAPENLTISTDWKIDQYQAVTTLTIKWDAVKGAIKYDVEWSRDDSDWVYGGRISTTELDVVGVYAGEYRARVRAMNSLNVLSPWAEIGPVQLNGKTDPPPVPVNVRTTAEVFGIRLDWGFPAGAEDSAFSQIQMASESTGQNPVDLGQFSYPTSHYLHSGMAAGVVRYFRVRLIDKTGNIGDWSPWVFGQSSADATAILDYITGKITETELGEQLLSEIEKISGSGPGSVNDRITTGDNALQDQIDSLQSQLADITGAPDWDVAQAYLTGQLVKLEGKLYRAKQDVPAGTPVTNQTYWEYIGDYASLGEMVTALAIRIDSVETSVEEINGELVAMATRIIGVETQVFPRMAGSTTWQAGDSGVKATAWTVYSAFSSADMALGRRIDNIEAEIGPGIDAKIEQEAYARATADETLAAQITTVSASLGEVDAALQLETSARATADEALTTQITNASSRIDTNEASIITEATTRASADSALSSSVTQLTSRVGTNESSIQTIATTQATTDGKLSTMYSIKLGINSNGQYYGAGMGIGIENTPSGMQSQILMLADRFAVLNTINGVSKAVFALEGGQAFLNSAVIKQADIVNLIITGELRSSNYIAGSQGIRINFVNNEFEINGVNPGVGRMNLTNQTLTVYDTVRMRVRLGIWS